MGALGGVGRGAPHNWPPVLSLLAVWLAAVLGARHHGGVFHTHFVCIGEMGIEELKKEVELVAAMLGKDVEELIEEMPILREVLGHD